MGFFQSKLYDLNTRIIIIMILPVCSSPVSRPPSPLSPVYPACIPPVSSLYPAIGVRRGVAHKGAHRGAYRGAFVWLSSKQVARSKYQDYSVPRIGVRIGARIGLRIGVLLGGSRVRLAN